MITEKIMPIAMFLFFIMIGVNAFIISVGELQDGTGQALNKQIGTGTTQLGSDIKNQADNTEPGSPAGSTPTNSTDTGFFTFITQPFWDNVVQPVSNFIGIDNVNLIDNAVNGLDKIMYKYIDWFPFLAPIFYAVIFFAAGIKILVFGYAGTILVRAIVGRNI